LPHLDASLLNAEATATSTSRGSAGEPIEVPSDDDGSEEEDDDGDGEQLISSLLPTDDAAPKSDGADPLPPPNTREESHSPPPDASLPIAEASAGSTFIASLQSLIDDDSDDAQFVANLQPLIDDAAANTSTANSGMYFYPNV
jgi:hypothetical protein